MTDAKSHLPLWPFLTADALFVGLALLLLRQGHKPLLWWEAMLLIACAAAAAGCGVLPFLRRDEDEQALAQARLLADSVSQLQKLDQVAAQVLGATNQWREYEQHAADSVAAAKAVSDSVAAESHALREFLQKVNDSEKAHLRVEAEKLRRAEAEWLQVLHPYSGSRLRPQPGGLPFRPAGLGRADRPVPECLPRGRPPHRPGSGDGA